MQRWYSPLILAALVVTHTSLAGLAPGKEDVVFLVDNSLFMKRVDKELALPGTIQQLVEKIVRDARVALILFDENASLEVPFVPVSAERVGGFLAGLSRIDYGDQFSNSAAAVERALHELQSAGRRGAGKSIILFTHGSIHTGNAPLDLNFSKWMSNVLAEDARQARIRIFCVAVADGGQTERLEGLAQSTGGAFYRVSNAADMDALLDRLAAALFPSRALAAPE
jgi:hypothetical protein